jgi:hypothetical protein
MLNSKQAPGIPEHVVTTAYSLVVGVEIMHLGPVL